MGKIKSAIEIALERTESIKSDKSGIEERELRQEGKKLASTFLQDPESVNVDKAIKSYGKEKGNMLKEGFVEVLLSHIQLPAGRENGDTLEKLQKAFQAVSPGLLGGERKISSMFQQLKGFLDKFISDLAQVEKAIKTQYAPKLKQKEQELSRRMGQEVRLDPMQDPEFLSFYKQNMGKLKEQYQQALDNAKEELRKMVLQ
jgi:hypothetical protein